MTTTGRSQPLGDDETVPAQRSWWDTEADDYYTEHGRFLGDDALTWGPEGWTEPELGLLGDLAGRDVLEFGAGAGQGSRWVAGQGARAVATDLSIGMLGVGRRLNAASDHPVPLVQADARRLPFAEASFDLVFSAYGAVPFIADTAALMVELARVLRPGGRLVFSTSHPIRWAFPDVPGHEGLTARFSYFDRSPYAERAGEVLTYAEHHRTVGDRVREVVAAGLVLDDLVEPEWPQHNPSTWGGWSPLRGELLPGSLIVCAHRKSLQA
ncbi:class I SAM-dependent methyltransferase [Calidifontibacter sp. DB0510]|uniref:Class I SAM-dependent methyltransferase n=1 Tax=Metallococcus carri TaxID=1656884 RepID=A0A967B3F0_9MICO|nr:class I SAM-dependent methyltransferase [Metallococcus carri]NHN54942.1 class I SAM-dependent methyltransferase [Metallococcus carri]NOP37288.1 class I SAM-dependent methyltransferase [Calidifontibacter sp. DB2511S]